MPNSFGSGGNNGHKPPRPQDIFNTLDRPPPEEGPRRPKSGRTEQFNVRVRPGFRLRVEAIARRLESTLGAALDAMLENFELNATLDPNSIPHAEACAGRTQKVTFWAREPFARVMGRVAAERSLSVSELLEDLLAKEIRRLDPPGKKFGVHLEQ
jgi:hypothetical protein